MQENLAELRPEIENVNFDGKIRECLFTSNFAGILNLPRDSGQMAQFFPLLTLESMAKNSFCSILTCEIVGNPDPIWSRIQSKPVRYCQFLRENMQNLVLLLSLA